MKKLMLSLLLVLAQTAGTNHSPASSKPHRQRMEVCFVVDTTGSMGGLIEGAKQKIWSIANELMSAKPAPELKLGLVAYRDRGDAYVVKSFKLTDDIDAVYGELRKFEAAGGGDTPESVNEALQEAVTQIDWSKDRDVLKLIFLVGDAPPHMDYADGPKYPAVCKEAVKRGIVINTVQCGTESDTTPVWQEIARLSEGSYVAIAQSGNMTVATTPMDEKLAELNRKIGSTLIPYGDGSKRREVVAKQAASEVATAPAAADRLSYNAKAGKTVGGSGELLDSLAVGALSLDKIETRNLPEELQSLDKDALRSRIEKAQSERSDLQKQIKALSREREAYLRAQTERKADSFDNQVAEIIQKQSARLPRQ